MPTQNEYLRLRWSVSRGADTYGYNICTLERNDGLKRSGNKWQCNGGGYDMVGTVVAGYLCQVHQARLLKLADKAYAEVIDGKYRDKRTSEEQRAMGPRHAYLYGMTAYFGKDGKGIERVSIDGACGLSSVERIAEAVGVHITADYVPARKRGTVGFFISWEE